MIVCEIRYRLYPDRRDEFEAYARTWTHLIERHGGTHYGFFMPRDPPAGTPMSYPAKGQAGPGDEAIALYGFPDEEAYRNHRTLIAADPDGIAANRRFADPPFVRYERVFLRPVPAGS